jgi:succinyl-CoA synthetase alpha subunit
MSIFIDRQTRVITQGVTGKTGAFHTRLCRDYANGREAFVAGVHPQRGGQDFEGMPIYASVAEARTATGADVSVVYVPPAGAAAAIWEAVEAGIRLVVAITEGIPVRDMLMLRARMRRREAEGHTPALLLGPNCPGLITPDEIKIGIMPGHIHRKGRIGVVSRSGTLTYEAVAQLSELGLGQSTAVGIGGDPINGLKHLDVMRAFQDDPETDAVIMIGEIGGPDEAECARWCLKNFTKPVVGFIAGVTAPTGRRMGHAGALISGGADTAEAKLAVMEECGFAVTRNPSEMARVLKQRLV